MARTFLRLLHTHLSGRAKVAVTLTDVSSVTDMAGCSWKRGHPLYGHAPKQRHLTYWELG